MIARKIALALALAVATSGPGTADSGVAGRDTLAERQRTQRIAQQRGIDLDVARDVQRREGFARRQQQNREIDRIQPPAPRLDVPRVRPNCQIPISGNPAIGRACR
jgi:hypothetical protein